MKGIQLILVFLIFCSMTSCIEDKDTNAPKGSIEDIYFEDYESPRSKWGFLNLQGTEVIPAQYDDVRDMIGPLAAANKKGRWGFIDKDNQAIIDFKYKQVQDFHENRAFVEDFQGNWLLINAKDHVIDTLDYDNFLYFKDGICAVSKNSRWGLIDQNNKVLIPAQYALLKSIDNENFIAKTISGYGVIDKSNETVLEFDYKRIRTIPNTDWLSFRTDKGYFYKQLATGKTSPTFQKTLNIFNNKTVVKKNDQWLMLDVASNFKKLKTLAYDKIEFGGEGFWKFRDGKKWGILDAEGNEMVPAKYDMLNQYHEGFMVFGINDLWGYLDSSGNEFKSAMFPLAWDYKNDYARVIGARGVGFMNKEGKLAVGAKYFEVRDFYNGLARFQEW